MSLTSNPSATTRVSCANHLGKRKARSATVAHRQPTEDESTLVALTLVLQEPFGIVGEVVVIAGCGRTAELLAKAFVVNGAKVYVASAEASIAPITTALTAAGPGSCIVIRADSATTSGRAALATHISKSEEPVDLLVNTPACAAAESTISDLAEEQSSRKKRKGTSDIVRTTVLLSKLHSEQPKWTVSRCETMHEVSQSTLRRNYEQAIQMETPGTLDHVPDPEPGSDPVSGTGPSPDPTDTPPVSHSATDPVDFFDQEEINDERETDTSTSVSHDSESPSESACGEPVKPDPSDGPCTCRCHCPRSGDLLSDEHLQSPELVDSFVELLDFPDRISKPLADQINEHQPQSAMEVIDTSSINAEPLDAGDALFEYVQQLHAWLHWDPASNSKGAEKRDFVEALTEIAALPLDSMSMEVRRLLVDGSDRHHRSVDASGSIPNNSAPVTNIIAALGSRDVLLKCKAANALGSICISRVAGQRLLDARGDVVLKSLIRMATCKNKWAQSDAFFVLGWIVVIADEAMLKQLARLVPTVVRFLHRSVTQDGDSGSRGSGDDSSSSSPASLLSEEVSNFRIYALVLLLNFIQRDVGIFASAGDATSSLMLTMNAIIQKLNAQTIVYSEYSSDDDGDSEEVKRLLAANCFEMTEFVELLRLTITFTSLLVDQIESVAPLVLEMKMLPSLLRLAQVLARVQEAELLGGDEETGDLKERMAAIVETVVASR